MDFDTIERKCYIVVYGTATLFSVVPLVVDQTIGNGEVLRADNTMLWCWLTAENATKQGDSSMAWLPWSQVRLLRTCLLYTSDAADE